MPLTLCSCDLGWRSGSSPVSLPSRGPLAMSGGMCGCHSQREGGICFWQPVGRDQGCCSPFHNIEFSSSKCQQVLRLRKPRLDLHTYSIISLIFLRISLFSSGTLMRQIFVCLLMSHNSCRLSSLFSFFGSFCTCYWVIPNDLSLTLLVCFI